MLLLLTFESFSRLDSALDMIWCIFWTPEGKESRCWHNMSLVLRDVYVYRARMFLCSFPSSHQCDVWTSIPSNFLSLSFIHIEIPAVFRSMIKHRKMMTICQGILTRNFHSLNHFLSWIPCWSDGWFPLFFSGNSMEEHPLNIEHPSNIEHPLNIEHPSNIDCLLQEWNVTVFTPVISRSSVTFTLLLTTSSSVKNIVTELLSLCLLINYAHNKIRRNWRSKFLSKEQWNKFPGLLFDQVLFSVSVVLPSQQQELTTRLHFIIEVYPDEKTVPWTGTDSGRGD